MKNLVFLITITFFSFGYSQQKNIGKDHNLLLKYMIENHDISRISEINRYIEYQYDYLSKLYPELSKYDKKQFVSLVISNINSEYINHFDYKKSIELSLKTAKEKRTISNVFYSEAIKVLYSNDTNGNNIERKVKNIPTKNKVEETAIKNFLEVAQFSKSFWLNNNTVTGKRDWVVWGADAWGGFVAGTLTGTLTVNPVIAYLTGLAGSELMSHCVSAVR